MQQDGKVFQVVESCIPPSEDELTGVAWAIAACAFNLDDALELADALQIPRSAFARAREQGPQRSPLR